MKLFKSHDANLFHYVTAVTYHRVPVFKSERACAFFIKALADTKKQCPFKLIGYVIMPDHVHLFVNPFNSDISDVMKRIKGKSAHDIIEWLRTEGHDRSLDKLALKAPQKREHRYAIWLKDFSSIDIWSIKFAQQKLQYIHNNPVRAGLCNHPAEWKWSSYRAYFPHEADSVPIEIDWQTYWKELPKI